MHPFNTERKRRKVGWGLSGQPFQVPIIKVLYKALEEKVNLKERESPA